MTIYSPSEYQVHGGIVLPIFALQAVTESGNNHDDPTLVLPFTQGMFFLRCTAMEGGASQELVVRIVTKDPAGDYWWTLLEFWPSLTDVGGNIKWPFMCPMLGEKIAVEYDLTDITSVTFAVNAVLRAR